MVSSPQTEGPAPQDRHPVPPLTGSVRKWGSWASWTVCLPAVAYSVAQILSPPLPPSPWRDLLITTPSLVLPLVLLLALVVALNRLQERTPKQLRVWTRTGVGFAAVHPALVGSCTSSSWPWSSRPLRGHRGGRGERSARRWFPAHGVLARMVGTLWFVTAPGALWQLTRLFRAPSPGR